MPDEPKKTFSDHVQFLATVVSPLLLVWVGVANTAVEKRINAQNVQLKDQHEQQKIADDRRDKLATEAFEQGKAKATHTQIILPTLSEEDVDKRRLSFLTMLAYVEQNQVPEFMLSVLSIHANRDVDPEAHIVEDLRTALVELSEQSNRETVKVAATRALKRLVTPEDLRKLAQGEEVSAATEANVRAITQVAERLAIAAEGDSMHKATAQQQLAVLRQTLSAVAVSSPDEAVVTQANSALAKSSGESNLVESAIAKVVADLPTKAPAPRVYLHIADEGQREDAAMDAGGAEES